MTCYIELLGTIIKFTMRYFTLYSGLIILLCACGQRSELINNTWVLIDGTMNGQPIKFKSTDIVIFSNRDGKEIQCLNFSKDETIILPGINSPKISAKWKIIDDKIYLSVDSSEYYIYNTNTSDLSFLDTSESYKVAEEDNVQPKALNPLLTKEFIDAVKVYEQPFDYYISLDTLRLASKDVIIRATRERKIDDLFKKL